MPANVNSHLTEVCIARPDALCLHSITVLRSNVQLHMYLFYSKIPVTIRVLIPMHSFVRHVDEVHIVNHLLTPPLVSLTEVHLLKVCLRRHTLTITCVVVIINCGVVNILCGTSRRRCCSDSPSSSSGSSGRLFYAYTTGNFDTGECLFYKLNECSAKGRVLILNTLCNCFSNILTVSTINLQLRMKLVLKQFHCLLVYNLLTLVECSSVLSKLSRTHPKNTLEYIVKFRTKLT